MRNRITAMGRKDPREQKTESAKGRNTKEQKTRQLASTEQEERFPLRLALEGKRRNYAPWTGGPRRVKVEGTLTVKAPQSARAFFF